MAMDKKMFGKLPAAVQVFIGIVMISFGAMMMLYSGIWAGGDIRFLILFLSVGVLYIATAIPQLFEFMATALQEEKEQDNLAPKKG
jgi:hypothetical protein